ncbi:MAG: SDR family NAD(P)-dependent oxidoreductase [Lachnospiraceae bacterium]
MEQFKDMFSLSGETAIVTGGATGLGYAITKCMVMAGAKVIVLGRTEKEKGERALQEFGNQVEYISFDVSNTAMTQKLVEGLIQKYGQISILVNNAGNHCKKLIEDMTVEDYCNVLNVHLVGAFALSKALFPHMKEKNKGSILFQASMASYIGQPEIAGYATAKAGYLGLVHTLASEGGPYNVRVNAIAPGWIETPMFHQATDKDSVRLNKILGRIPMNRIGNPMDIGMAAVYLCSKAGGYITGTCLPVDGGALIGF